MSDTADFTQEHQELEYLLLRWRYGGIEPTLTADALACHILAELGYRIEHQREV